MNYSKFKRLRVIIALLFFSFTLLPFIDLYEWVPDSLVGQILFLQFLPSLFRFLQVLSIGSVGFVIVLILTLVLGRFYCSAICPLGILQDMFAYLSKIIRKKKCLYKFKKSQSIIRYSIMGISVIAFVFSISLVLNLLDPYSNSGRIFTYIFKPFLVWVNNVTATQMQSQGVYSMHIIERASTSWAIFFYMLVLLLVIAYLSLKRGRLFCNLICPVGTLLGMISKKSYLKVHINNNSCTKCGKCAGVCKSECIDLKSQSVDYSRCVACFNCLPVCEDNAIEFSKFDNTPRLDKHSDSKELKYDRRRAISSLLLLTASATVLAQGHHRYRKGRRLGGELKLSVRENPVAPPGSKSIARFNSLCTACGLCISACPTGVLQPAVKEYGLIGFMQPHMDYVNAGFCNYDCNRCGEICPTGAILPLKIEEKQLTQLGKAVFVKHNCIVHRDGTSCGACSEHCPTKAVDMVPYRDELVIPRVNEDICIGCGACEHPCPVEYPNKAIYVESNVIHQQAQKPVDEESNFKPLEEDFPF